MCFSGFGNGTGTSYASGFGSLFDKIKNYHYLPPASWTRAIISFILSPFAHAGLLHILMNSLVLVTEGGSLEKSIRAYGASSNNAPARNNQSGGGGAATIVNGVISPSSPRNPSQAASYFNLSSASSTFLALTVILHVASTSTMALLHLLPYYTFNLHNSCVYGFSGILFGYIAYHCYSAPRGSQMLFCGANVPAPVLPWILIGFTFLLMPMSSFAGHLAGVVWGIGLARVPVLGDLMKRLGQLFGRAAFVCPSFMRAGGLSRGTSPTNSFAMRNDEPASGQSSTQTNGGTFQMSRPTHPNMQDWAAAEEGRANPSPNQPVQGIPLQTAHSVVVGGPTVTQQGTLGSSNFKPFQGEGRKLGSNAA